jgi:hypothetical protein
MQNKMKSAWQLILQTYDIKTYQYATYSCTNETLRPTDGQPRNYALCVKKTENNSLIQMRIRYTGHAAMTQSLELGTGISSKP